MYFSEVDFKTLLCHFRMKLVLYHILHSLNGHIVKPLLQDDYFLFQSPDAGYVAESIIFYSRFIRNVDRFVVEIVRLKEIKEKQEAMFHIVIQCPVRYNRLMVALRTSI